MNEFTNNDKLLELIKAYFNDFFDEQEKKLEKIEAGQSLVFDRVEAINASIEELSAHVIIYTDENKKLSKYLHDLARLNGWKLPEKQKKPAELE